jgi:RNA polymerase sigma-70 factor (ECF subfamily)
VTVATVLAGLFGLGRLFCPANVFVSGTIIDAATGAYISNAELRLLHPYRRGQREENRPNARSGKDGRFNLYVGWYAASQPVAISAAGYETLKTTLGARPLGERRVKRDFQLSLTGPPENATAVSPELIPPVVIRTIPESGASDVDPALTELRVTFSKPMQDGGWSWTRLDEQSFPETTGEPRYLENGRTCVLPVELQPGRCYAIWLNTDRLANFKDTNGLSAVPYLLIFQTSVQPQNP